MSFAGPSHAKNAKKGKRGGTAIKVFEKDKNEGSEYAQIIKNSGEHLEIIVEGNKQAKCIIPGKFSRRYRFNIGEYILVKYESSNVCEIIGKLSDIGKKLAEKSLNPTGSNIFVAGADESESDNDDLMPPSESDDSDNEKEKIEIKKKELKSKDTKDVKDVKDTKNKKGNARTFSENPDAYVTKKKDPVSVDENEDVDIDAI